MRTGEKALRKIVRQWASLLVVASAAMLLAVPSASANPSGISPAEGIAFFGLMFLFIGLVNFPVNLTVVTLSLVLTSRKYRKSIGRLPGNTRAFYFTVLLVVAIISAFGAVIDFVFVADSKSNLFWVPAVVLIFVSCYVPSRSLLRIRPIPSLLSASVLAAVNPMSWIAYTFLSREDIDPFTVSILVALVSIPICAVLGWLLARWHRNSYSCETMQSEPLPLRVRRATWIFAIVVTLLLVPPFVVNAMTPPHHYEGPPDATYTPNINEEAVKISIISITKSDIKWSDVEICLWNDSTAVSWHPDTKYYSAQQSATHSESPLNGTPFGNLIVWCNVTDIRGNGVVGGGDYFTIETGSSPTLDGEYVACLAFEPTGSRMGSGVLFNM